MEMLCLGMQLLFDSSEEFGYTKGLGLIEGKVVKFDKDKMQENLKIPHMGWNKIINKQNPLFKDLKERRRYNFCRGTSTRTRIVGFGDQHSTN